MSTTALRDHCTRAHALVSSLESTLFESWWPGQSSSGIRTLVRESGDITDNNGVALIASREELLRADAIDSGDRAAMAAQVRRLADKIHAIWLEAADAIANEAA